MQMILRLAAALMFSAGLVAGGEAPKPKSVDDAIAGLLTREGPERKADELDADYAFAIGELVKGLAGDDMSKWQASDTKLDALCCSASAPGRPAHRLAAARALVANIKAQGLTALGSERVIRHIERIGAGEAVPARAALLAEQELREPARRALMSNPDPAATRALADAVPKADKEFRVALAAALGFRRDPAAVQPLLPLAQDSDDDIRTCALESLALIGNAAAADAIAAALAKGSPPGKIRATNAYLLLADALTAKGDKAAALQIYGELLGPNSTAKCAALIGIGKAGSAKEVETLVAAIVPPNPAERGAATQGLILLADKAATAAIAEKAGSAEPGLKAILIGVLGKRGEAAAAPIVLEAAKSDDAGVRAAAYEALGDLKAEAGTPLLVAALKTAKDDERDKAEAALARIPGKETTKALVAALDGAGKDAKCVLLRSLGRRGDAETLDTLLTATKDAEENVRVAAFMAIGQLNQATAVPAILDALTKTEGKVKEAAVAALRGTRGPEATAACVEAAKTAPPAALAPLLNVLSERNDPAVKGLLAASARHADPAVRAAAIEGLARAKDPSVVPLLIEAATKGEGLLREVAVRICLDYTAEIIKADKGAAAAIYALACDRKIVPQPDDRKVAVRALAEVGTPDVVDALCSTFRDRQVAADAVGAVEAIADRVAKANDKEAAVRVYSKLALLCPDAARLRRAQGELRKLGVEGDLARKAGFVTRWLVAGPFPNKDNAMITRDLPVEKDEVDQLLPAEAMGVSREWKPLMTADPAGVVDLNAQFNKEAQAGAYLYAEVSVPTAGPALLKLSYEEGCVAYVNGKKVHSRAGARLDRLDDQQVKVELKAGVARILLKVGHLDKGWSVAARLTRADDQALGFTQAEK